MSATIEERVATLEAELAKLKAQTKISTGERSGVIGRTAPDFLDQFVGMYANDEMAERVFKHIENEREREREEAQHSSNEDDT